MSVLQFIYLFVCYGLLGCLCLLAIVSNAPVNMDEPISILDLSFSSFASVPRNATARLW
jgi:hypothetical protein